LAAATRGRQFAPHPGPSVPAAAEDRPLPATRPVSYPAARPGMTQRD
jgi:hypothetical protein